MLDVCVCTVGDEVFKYPGDYTSHCINHMMQTIRPK